MCVACMCVCVGAVFWVLGHLLVAFIVISILKVFVSCNVHKECAATSWLSLFHVYVCKHVMTSARFAISPEQIGGSVLFHDSTML